MYEALKEIFKGIGLTVLILLSMYGFAVLVDALSDGVLSRGMSAISNFDQANEAVPR